MHDRYPQITSIRKLDDDFSSFSSHSNFIRASSQTFLGKNDGQIQLDNMYEHGNYWGLLQYPWLKIHPAKYNNLLQYFTMNTTLTKWLKNGFAKHQNRLEFQYFISLRKSTNRLNWETSGVSGPTEKLSAFVAILLQPLAQQQKSYLKDWYSQLTPLSSLTGLRFQRAQYLNLWT